MSGSWFKAKLKKLVGKLNDGDVENKLRAGSAARHEDLSSFLAAPAGGAEEVQEQSSGLAYHGCTSSELSSEDLGNQRDEVKPVMDNQGAAAVSDPSLTSVNSLVKHFDTLPGKSETDCSIREARSYEHSFDINERAQMKAKGAIPKIPVIKNHAKPLDPVGSLNSLPQHTCHVSEIADKSREFFCNSFENSANAFTKLERRGSELTEKNETSGMTEEKACAHPRNSMDERADDLFSIQDNFFAENKLVMHTSSSDEGKSVENQGNETTQCSTSPKGIKCNPGEKLSRASPVGLMYPESRQERDCSAESVTQDSTEITDLLTTAQLQMSNLQIRPKKNELSLDRRDIGQERRLGNADSSKNKTIERRLSTQTKGNRPRSVQRSKVSCKEGRRSGMSCGSSDSVRIAEKSNLDINTKKNPVVGHARKVPEPKGGAKQVSKKAAQHTDSDGKVKTKTVGNKGNVSNKEVSNKERPQERTKSKNSMSENFLRKETKVNVSQEASSNSVRIADESNLDNNTKKRPVVGHARKVPEPKDGAKQVSKKAAQHTDPDGKVKTQTVGNKENVSNKEVSNKERPQERIKSKNIMSENFLRKETKVNALREASSNRVKTHSKTVGTKMKTRKETEDSELGPSKSVVKKPNCSPKGKIGTPKAVSVNIPSKTAIQSANLEGYLKNLLPSTMTFKVIDFNKSDGENSRTTVEFPSTKQARKVVNLLTKNSGKTGVRANMIGKDVALQKDVIVEFLRTQREEVLRKGNELIEQHQIKIDKQKTEISNLKTTKFVQFDIYYTMKIEREALESKLEELTLQRDEFTTYHKGILERIEALGKHTKPKNKVKNLRLEFGLECRKLTAALPIYARRSHIIDTVSSNSVSVILGETGSGKSTQLVQYLHQAQNLGLGEIGSKMIVCTQPRKVAAQSLAKHVADEMGTMYGGIVGYKAGFVSKISAQTKVVFTTDHNLLNECLKDPLLEKYSCVIIDEAHERSIYTDLLLGMIKKCLKERKDLRVIVTSATIDPDVFVRYFGGAPVLRVSGRMFPVEVVYKDVSEPSRENYLQEAVEKVREIHEYEPEGDILVFLTSPLETQKACERLESTADLDCLPLHGQLQAQEQQRVFEPVALGKRKVVFATNSAETSITIPGIKYVVDTGLVKEKVFDAKKNMSALVVKAISKSSAEQRKGRAGRMSSGKCYRLYTEKEFKTMDQIALPEILRVHLGQALLKLMEIGVADPLLFDFVQSPSEDALESAVKILKQLKAIDESGITETGKKLALMPVEPRMAKVIFDAIECGCGLEGIAVAALSSISGSVFYRMGTEEDKKQADYYKTRFCQPEGDVQTFLQVYKEWDSTPEKKKSAWCVKNYINGKSIRACRENIIEIQRILKKDLGIIIQYKFADNFDGSSISNILLDCFRSNIGYFTGHSKSGYFVVFDAEDRFLQIHPSSSLSYLASTPKWVVFLDVLKTSSDYMLNVVTLDDSEIQKKIDTEDFIINEKKLDEITVTDNVVAEVGSSLMSFLIGPKFQNLKAMERELNAKYEQIVVLEPQRDKSQMKAFTTPRLSDDIKKYLQRKIAPEQLKLQKEVTQIPVTHNSHTKALLDAGGLCSDILMPDETRTLLLRNVPDEWTKSDVEREFEKFGEISDVFPFTPSRNWHGGNKPWGKVTFFKADSVKNAMDSYEGVVLLFPDGVDKRTTAKNEFKIRLQWCRRPTKGLAFVTPRDPEDAMLLSGRRMLINGSIVTIRLDRKDTTKLFIAKLSRSTTENDVKHALNQEVPIESVRMPRENVGETQAEMLTAITGRMNMKLMEFAKRDEFSVTIMKPKAASFEYFGFVNFSNPETGLVAINRLNGSVFDGKQLSAYPELRTSLHVQKDVYATLKNQLDGVIQQLRADHRSLKLNIKELKSGHFAINLEADSVDLMSNIRNSLHEMISGHRIECASKEDEQALFSPPGKDLFSRLQRYLGLLIRVDNRLRTVTMYGDRGDITEGKEEIKVFLGRFQNMKTREISLRGEGKPPGLMKYLLLEHGLEMTTLREHTGVAMLTVVLQKHMLTATGNVESLEKLADAVSDAVKKIEENHVVSRPEDIDCTVCFCPIDGKIYRLEDCGHPYCSECIGDLIKNGINSKQFPILCTDEECQHPLVWKDFNNMLGSEKREQLMKSSVEKFVAQNPETYKFCSTADCVMVYRVGYNEGLPYECAGCGIIICTKCHTQYHHGLSCAMYLSKLKTPDYDLEDWVREKPDIRALCPGCKTPIEKNGGCSHMHCTQCNVHICWWCKKTFRSAGETYDHQGSCNRIDTL